ncbi:hypothetical protein EPI10_024496 [Gossypium australe]|uniref:Uncharacterized protein n=1 Tax=Gossypium australe TaxID=47621 RepID=A0A5B6VYV7_9ROSI|nr:hypothetical protein EPI10_024496 [Gossypium australe]
MARNERTFREYALLSLEVVQESIKRSSMIEDPNQNLKWFLQLCDTFKYNGVTNDAIDLQLLEGTRVYHDIRWTCWKILTEVFPNQQNSTTKKRNC